MKTSYLKLYLTIFLLILGKSVFDIQLFSQFFETNNSSYAITMTFGYASIIGFLIVTLFNYLQRAFRFGISILYTYFLLMLIVGFHFYLSRFNIPQFNMGVLVGFNISLNFLIILMIKGLHVRLGGDEEKKVEKSSNIASHIALFLAGILLIFVSILFKSDFFNYKLITYFSFSTITLSYFSISYLLKKDKRADAILDNLQEIKTKQNLFKLLKTKYFTSILVSTALTAIAIVCVYSLFIKVNISKYDSAIELSKMISIAVIIFSFLSILYELFLKEKAFYNFSINIHLILMPLVVFVFGSIFLTNTFYFRITQGDELFFFVPIMATVFLVLSHFSFFNLLLPVINTLYLPLKRQNQNDFYIKSCFWGFVIGIGLASLLIRHTLPELNFINNSGYVVLSTIVTVILVLLNRFLLYNNYKHALHNKLNIEENSEGIQKSFMKTITQKIKDYPGIKIVRIINLLYIINPVNTKRFLSELAISEDTLTQRAGIISAIRFYLLEIYDQMVEISKTKYFPSSPNRDKVEQLLRRFEEIKIKMQKNYYIHQLSISKSDIERVKGGILARFAPENQQYEILNRLVTDSELPVAKNAIISAAGFKEKEIVKSITEKLKIAELSNAAYSALLYIDKESLKILDNEFYKTGQSEKVQLKIVRLFGDIANETAVEYLLKKLNYTNQNIISAALEALSKSNFKLPEKKAVIIRHELEEVCRYLVWNTSLLIDIKKDETSDILVEALEIEIKYNYKSLFDLLSLLFNPASVELIRKNLWAKDYEKVAFALELASLIITDELKSMILPIIRPMTKTERVKKMQTIFTTEKMSKRDVLYDLIQRDYKWVNPWTKACAIMELSKFQENNDVPLLLANMVNPDPMIAELSALSVFSMNKTVYYENKKIFDNEFTDIIGNKSVEAIEKHNIDNADKMPVLKFEIIKYLQKIDEFSTIPGEILKSITDIVTPLFFPKGEEIDNIDNLDISNFHYVVCSGDVLLKINDIPVKTFGKESFVSSLDFLFDYDVEISLFAETNVRIYKIDSAKFADILSFYDEIPFSVLNNSSPNKL
ncbi:MAG: HEAT repeat domain-containing protein, partial [Bacteroidota bacterium]